MVVSPHDLARLIVDDLEGYTKDVEETVEKTIHTVSKEALQAIQDSPDIQHLRQCSYGKGFRVKDIYKARGKNKGDYRLVITNLEYRLTHLLENGHAIWNGGRTRAFKHWINGQKVADTLPDRIKEALEREH